jgi:hypothetical protein
MNGLTAIGRRHWKRLKSMESNLIDAELLAIAAQPTRRGAQCFDVHGYFYGERSALLPQLTGEFTNCGVWVLERRTLSPAASDFRFELQLGDVVELYGALVALGLEFTRSAHTTLTDLCTCRRYREGSGVRSQVLTLRLEINFLADVTLHSILMTGSGTA